MNGRQTKESVIINQKTFTYNDTLFREINFNDSTFAIESYTFYFYRNGRLFSEESYNQHDTLTGIVKHQYNSRGLEEETLILERAGNKFLPAARTTFLYDNTGNLLTKKEFFTGKKPYRVTTYEYSGEKPVREWVRTKKPADIIVLKALEYQYNPVNMLVTKTTRLTAKDKSVTVTSDTCLYNDNGQLTGVDTRNMQGKVLIKKRYEYYANGKISKYYEKNINDEITLYHSYAYRHTKINKGTQKSYFD
jgi:hypothetical protein